VTLEGKETKSMRKRGSRSEGIIRREEGKGGEKRGRRTYGLTAFILFYVRRTLDE